MGIPIIAVVYKVIIFGMSLWLANQGLILAREFFERLDQTVELEVDGTKGLPSLKFRGTAAAIVILASLGLAYTVIAQPFELRWDPPSGRIVTAKLGAPKIGDSLGWQIDSVLSWPDSVWHPYILNSEISIIFGDSLLWQGRD